MTKETTKKELKEVVEKPKTKKKDKKQWEFKCYSGLLKKLINRVKMLNTEIKINVDQKGISTKVVDPAHVAMVYISIPRKDFYTGHTAVNKENGYKCREPFDFGIDLDKLSKTLKLCSEYDYLTGYIQNNSLYIDTDKIHKKIGLLDTAGMPEPKIPELQLDVKAEVSSSDIGILIKASDETCDYLSLIADKTGLYSVIEEDEDNLKIDLSKDVKGNGRAIYSTDYFSNIIKGIGYNHVTLEFSTDQPIQISGDIYDTGSFMYLLAPRIEGEKDER